MMGSGISLEHQGQRCPLFVSVGVQADCESVIDSALGKMVLRYSLHFGKGF